MGTDTQKRPPGKGGHAAQRVPSQDSPAGGPVPPGKKAASPAALISPKRCRAGLLWATAPPRARASPTQSPTRQRHQAERSPGTPRTSASLCALLLPAQGPPEPPSHFPTAAPGLPSSWRRCPEARRAEAAHGVDGRPAWGSRVWGPVTARLQAWGGHSMFPRPLACLSVSSRSPRPHLRIKTGKASRDGAGIRLRGTWPDVAHSRGLFKLFSFLSHSW